MNKLEAQAERDVERIEKLARRRRLNETQTAARDADQRPKKGGWAPGKYLCRCLWCRLVFFGDKRAVECAPCAYQD